MDDEQVQQAGALFIDVGGGTTDVALVRQGGIEGTRMFALGGRAFTKSLADRLELPFGRAEEIKVDFAKGVAVDRADEVGQIIAEDVAVWSAGVELVLEEFAKEGMLPGRIYLCGGGARLPQIGAALRDPEFARHLSFARPPQVEAITVNEVAQLDRRDRAAGRRAGHPAHGARPPGARDERGREAARRGSAARAAPDEGLSAMTVCYLEADDEITTAIGRIRAVEDGEAIIVLPPGSRIATGRINFKLLAREASERHLTVVAVSDEPQVRALAISAGLPAYDSLADRRAGAGQLPRAGSAPRRAAR